MTTKPEADQAAAKMAQMLLQWDQELKSAASWERAKLLARARRMDFMALLAAGFTEQQALFLVKPN